MIQPSIMLGAADVAVPNRRHDGVITQVISQSVTSGKQWTRQMTSAHLGADNTATATPQRKINGVP